MLELDFPDVLGVVELLGRVFRELALESVDLVQEVAVPKMRIHVDDEAHGVLLVFGPLGGSKPGRGRCPAVAEPDAYGCR